MLNTKRRWGPDQENLHDLWMCSGRLGSTWDASRTCWVRQATVLVRLCKCLFHKDEFDEPEACKHSYAICERHKVKRRRLTPYMAREPAENVIGDPCCAEFGRYVPRTFATNFLKDSSGMLRNQPVTTPNSLEPAWSLQSSTLQSNSPTRSWVGRPNLQRFEGENVGF